MAEAIDRKFWEAGRAAAAQASVREVRKFPAPARAGALRWHIVHVVAKFERGIAQPESFVAKEIVRAGFEVYSVRLRKMVMPRSQSLSAGQRKHRHLLAREKISRALARKKGKPFLCCRGDFVDAECSDLRRFFCGNGTTTPPKGASGRNSFEFGRLLMLPSRGL